MSEMSNEDDDDDALSPHKLNKDNKFRKQGVFEYRKKQVTDGLICNTSALGESTQDQTTRNGKRFKNPLFLVAGLNDTKRKSKSPTKT